MTTVTETPVSNSIDPRVQARRKAVSRQRMMRRRAIMFAVLGFFVVVAAAIGVMFTPLFDVDRIVVRGAGTTDAELITRASQLHLGDALVMVQPGTVSQRVARVPYVATARAKRVFPGTVVITVTERSPIAWTALPEGGAALIDASGRVLEVRAEAPANLVRIDGLTQVPAPGAIVEPRALPGVIAQLPPGLRSLVGVLSAPDNEVTLQLIDEVSVRLGDSDHIAAKGAVAEAVLSRSKAGTRVVDVRVPTSPVTS
ncbi:MAG: cell division protein FtsQ/DivIB [Acidimicrobiia bacterium]